VPSLDEVFYYLRGIWMMVRNDPAGLQYLDITMRGVWRSFWSYAYAIPAMAFLWAAQRNAYLSVNPDDSAGFGFIVREIGVSVVATVLFLAAVALASRQFGFSHRFAHWLVAANWLGLATTYVQAVPLALMVLVKQNGILVLIYLVALIGIIAAGFRVYRFALGNNASLAAVLVASELVWGVTINYLTG